MTNIITNFSDMIISQQEPKINKIVSDFKKVFSGICPLDKINITPSFVINDYDRICITHIDLDLSGKDISYDVGTDNIVYNQEHHWGLKIKPDNVLLAIKSLVEDIVIWLQTHQTRFVRFVMPAYKKHEEMVSICWIPDRADHSHYCKRFYESLCRQVEYCSMHHGFHVELSTPSGWKRLSLKNLSDVITTAHPIYVELDDRPFFRDLSSIISELTRIGMNVEVVPDTLITKDRVDVSFRTSNKKKPYYTHR